MNTFINDWGTEVALVIAISTTMLVGFLGADEMKKHKSVRVLMLSAGSGSVLALAMYFFALGNGVNL